MKQRLSFLPLLGLLLFLASSVADAEDKKPPKYEFKVETLKEQPVMTVRFKVPAEPDKISAKYAEVFGAVFAHVLANGAQPAGAPFGRYHVMKDDGFEIEAGIPVAKAMEEKGDVKASKLPGGKVATTVHFGSYHELGKAFAALQKWVGDQGYQPAGGHWEAYLTDPGQEADQSKWQTKLFLPIAAKDAAKSN